MSSTESFDELERKFAARMETALSEIKEEFFERLQGASNRLDEDVKAELVAAKEEAAAAVASVAEAEAVAEESRAALLAEAEEAKVAAIAEALEAKEAEFAEILAARDAGIAEIEQARDTALAAAEEARSALLVEAEETKSAAISDALLAKDNEISEILGAREAAVAEIEEARDAALAEAEEAKVAALATAKEEKQAAVEEARAAAEQETVEAIGLASLQLHEVVTKIDTASSQTEVLEALLAGTTRYASRSLLFLTREDGLQGWGGNGFDTAEGHLQAAHLDYADGSDWQKLSKGKGTVEMGADACTDLCQTIDSSNPHAGALIPLVLRNRLAATLYADRLAEDSPFQLAVLQLITYVAGQALEALPLRQRSATATLRMAVEIAKDEPGLELWQYLAPEEPPTEIEEPAPATAATVALTAEETFVEPPVSIEEIPAPEPETPRWQETAEDAGFEVEEVAAVEEVEEPPIEEPLIEEPIAEVEEEIEEQLPEAQAEAEQEPVAEIEPPVRVDPPEPVEPSAAVAPPTEVAPPAAGAEVSAPEDVDGPGWAFTTRRFSGEGGDDATHEEARRLARLLVTEIKLYNEEQVEEGRRSRSIYRTLKEDIDRSRQIYEERIDEAVRMDTDYFQDELVKILAAGDAEVMGM